MNTYPHNSYENALKVTRICEVESMMLFLLIRKSCKNCKMRKNAVGYGFDCRESTDGLTNSPFGKDRQDHMRSTNKLRQ